MLNECTENYIEVNGTRLCWFEWGTDHRDAGTVLLIHATGFHARCWDQTVKHLPGRHVISVDMRGHGRSDNTPPFSWDVFGRDVIEFVRSLDLDRITAAGHSMGGHSLVQAVAEEQSRFDELVLIDPVILPPEVYADAANLHDAWLSESGEHPVARRRNNYDDARAMFDNFAGRGSFAAWQDEVLYDYCQYGLLPNPEGPGYVLACPPKVEAAIYMGSSGTDIYDKIDSITVPTIVLRAKQRDANSEGMDFSKSPTWEKLASRFANGRDVYLPELTHFIPMEDPGLVADYLEE